MQGKKRIIIYSVIAVAIVLFVVFLAWLLTPSQGPNPSGVIPSMPSTEIGKTDPSSSENQPSTSPSPEPDVEAAPEYDMEELGKFGYKPGIVHKGGVEAGVISEEEVASSGQVVRKELEETNGFVLNNTDVFEVVNPVGPVYQVETKDDQAVFSIAEIDPSATTFKRRDDDILVNGFSYYINSGKKLGLDGDITIGEGLNDPKSFGSYKDMDGNIIDVTMNQGVQLIADYDMTASYGDLSIAIYYYTTTKTCTCTAYVKSTNGNMFQVRGSATEFRDMFYYIDEMFTSCVIPVEMK